MKIGTSRLLLTTTCAYVENLSKLKSGSGERVSKVNNLKEPGSAITIIIEIDGNFYRGDAISVQYANVYGRSSPIQKGIDLKSIERYINQHIPREISNSFISACQEIENSLSGHEYKIPLCYGISQAILKAIISKGVSLIKTIEEEFNYKATLKKPLILVQTNRHDLETIRSALELEPDILPHANFCTKDLVGSRGEKFLEYFSDVVGLVRDYGQQHDYNPTLHFDLYGTLGEIFSNKIEDILDYIKKLSDISGTIPLQIESPVILSNRESHFEYVGNLRNKIRTEIENVKIVLDEWANTLDDIKSAVDLNVADIIQIKMPDLGSISNSIAATIYCNESGHSLAYLGGTSNETIESALITTEIACSVSPHQVLAKPGMDINCGYSLVKNLLQIQYADI